LRIFQLLPEIGLWTPFFLQPHKPAVINVAKSTKQACAAVLRRGLQGLMELSFVRETGNSSALRSSKSAGR